MKKLKDFDKPVKRAEKETDIKKRQDRVGRYLKKYLDNFVFDQFSDAFMEKAKVKDLMKGVPIPLRKEDIELFKGGQGLKTVHIAENMAWIMGIDPKFKYTEHYIAFLAKVFNYKIYEGMVKKGRDAAEKGDFDTACIQFRASLCMKPDYLHGMYSYARVCREMYMAGKNEEYIGRFKAESIEYFELLTEAHPKFAQSYYYLGYAYLNLGLYTKAQITWKQYIEKSLNGKDKKEIKERLVQIEDPVKIEAGCNDVMAGRFADGITRLEAYKESQFNKWWPMWYYLGVAYARGGEDKAALESFKKVLALNASHVETMEELVSLYRNAGDKENEQKYVKKIALIKSQKA